MHYALERGSADVAPAAAGIGLAATGFSAMGAFEGASTAAQGDMLEAQNATNAAQIGQTKAAETDADMNRRLTSQLANIGDPLRRRPQPHSPTGAAISANVQGVGDLSRTQAVENIQNQSQMDKNAAQFYTSSASSALMGGELGAAGSTSMGSRERLVARMASSGSRRQGPAASAASLAWRAYRWRPDKMPGR